jgi:hypothetical protein
MIYTPETVKVVSGTTVTASSWIVAVSIQMEPVLQVVALIISIVVGVLTAIWTYKKIKNR